MSPSEPVKASNTEEPSRLDSWFRRLDVLLLSHKTDLVGPTEYLIAFLRARVGKLEVVLEPFYYCNETSLVLESYREGVLTQSEKRERRRTREPWIYVSDFLFALSCQNGPHRKHDIVIAMDPLNTAAALLLKTFRRAEQVVFYSIDWSVERFPGHGILNIMYRALDFVASRSSDFVWNVSGRMASHRQSIIGRPGRSLVVPVGVSDKSLANVSTEEANCYDILYLGALAPSKGADLLLESLEELLRIDDRLTVTIIGGVPRDGTEFGRRIPDYQQLFQEFGPRVQLLGTLSHDALEQLLPRYGVGLAPYHPDMRSISYYGDPSRIKDYLWAGLPVIATRVPEIASKLESSGAGIVIDYSKEALVTAVSVIVKNPEAYRQFRRNALELSKQYSWSVVLTEAFTKLMGVY